MQNGTVQLRAGSEAVREFFSDLGVTTSWAPEKRVPWAIFGAPIEVQAAFLRGLFGADGCVSRESGTRDTVTSASEAAAKLLLKDVQRLLNALEFGVKIYSISAAPRLNFQYTRVDGTEVRTSRARATTFGSPDLTSRRSRTHRLLDSAQAARARAMLVRRAATATKPSATLVAREDDGQEYVYNLTEPLNHSYIVNGFLLRTALNTCTSTTRPATSPRSTCSSSCATTARSTPRRSSTRSTSCSGAGDHRRPVELSDRGDRPQRPRDAPARPRLREPRRAADGARPALRLGRGSLGGGRDHGADDGARVPDLGRDRGGDRPV